MPNRPRRHNALLGGLTRTIGFDRGSACKRGYGRRWRRLRAAYLGRNPFCVHCEARGLLVGATDVDHILAKRKGGTDHKTNLQALCHACHARKTAKGE